MAPNQIEAALGYPVHHTFPSDYIGVSMSINAGVPIVSSANTEMASQLDGFAQQLLSAGQIEEGAAPEKKKAALTFSFFSW